MTSTDTTPANAPALVGDGELDAVLASLHEKQLAEISRRLDTDAGLRAVTAAPGPAAAPVGGQRDALFALGMAAVSLSAAVSSYSGLASLADLAGWNHRLALLLPLTIDAYAVTATRVWLSPKTAGRRARRWAKGNAVGAIATSVAGNAVSHAAAAHVFTPSWPVVVMVSAIPSIVLGLITHLWHLRNTPDPAPAGAAGWSALTAAAGSRSDTEAPLPVAAPVPVSAAPSGLEAPVPDPVAAVPITPNGERKPGRKSAAETADEIAALRAEHPEASQVAIGKRLGLTDRTVRKYWATTAPETA
jgi:hypothetical protein